MAVGTSSNSMESNAYVKSFIPQKSDLILKTKATLDLGESLLVKVMSFVSNCDMFTYFSFDEFEKTYASPNVKVDKRFVTPYAIRSADL